MGTKQTILILEDEKDLAELYARRLRENGYATVIALNGLEGLEALKHVKPDLILLDLGMPKMGGVEFYQHLCGKADYPRFPVLVLTGRGNLEAVFKDFQVDGFITKPFDSEHLVAEIAAVLKKQDRKKLGGSFRRIMIIDNNKDVLNDLAKALVNAGYKVETADSGTAGLEKITTRPPDLAIVQLGLEDVPGDLVVLRLQQMAKTKDVGCLLYTRATYTQHPAIMAGFANKTGVRLMWQYSNPMEMVVAVTDVFKKLDEENAFS